MFLMFPYVKITNGNASKLNIYISQHKIMIYKLNALYMIIYFKQLIKIYSKNV